MAFATTAGWVGTVSGRVENLVLVDSPYGTIIRTRPERSRDKSPLQQASRLRMARASREFGALTREEGRLWARFGEGLAEPHPRTGRVVGLSAQQAFNRLAYKLLQVDPLAELPRTPPTEPFFGDGVRISVLPPPPAPSSSPDTTFRGLEALLRGDEEGFSSPPTRRTARAL